MDMHISRRLLHTTLYIHPPKLILAARFVVKKYPGLMDKTRKHMYTLHRFTWDDMVKESSILPDGQTTTLVCHRPGAGHHLPPPTYNASVVHTVVLK